MKRLLFIVAIVVGLVSAGVVLPADQASAHQFDNYSLWFCTVHKSDPGNHVWVNHSVPVDLDPGIATYKCSQYDTTVFGHPEYRYYVVWNTTTGASWRQGGYDWCGDGCPSPH